MLKKLILIGLPILFCVLMVAGFEFLAALGMGLYLGFILAVERIYKKVTGDDLDNPDKLVDVIRKLFTRENSADRS